MKKIYSLAFVLITALVVVACDNKDAVAEWLAPQLKYPFIVINKGTQEGDAFIKTYDCSSQVIVYTRNSTGITSIPFQEPADYNVCKGVK